MKKEILAHTLSFIVLFALITIIRLAQAGQPFELAFVLFWIGGLIGTFLPDIDHLIYVYFLKPHELTSQRATNLMQQGQVTQTADLLVSTQNERQNMIFHTIWFQLVFLGLTFLVMTSSSSLFGWGLVLAFSLHLLIDQIQDYQKYSTLNNWFNGSKFALMGQAQLFYMLAVSGILIFLALFS